MQLQGRPHVEHVRLCVLLQGLAQGRRVAVRRIASHPIGPHQPLTQQVPDECHCQFRFGAVRTGGQRYPRPDAAGGIAAPGLGQVKLPAHQARRGAPAQHGKHAHLPVADFAHLPDILAAYPDAFGPLLLPAALVQPHSSSRTRPAALVQPHSSSRRSCSPATKPSVACTRRATDKVVQRIIRRIGQALIHAFHVAAASVKQPLDILLTMR